MKFIGKLIAEGVIPASLGRVIEISIYGVGMSVLAYLGNALQTGVWSDWRFALGGILSTFVAAILSGASKELRQKQEDTEKLLKELYK